MTEPILDWLEKQVECCGERMVEACKFANDGPGDMCHIHEKFNEARKSIRGLNNHFSACEHDCHNLWEKWLVGKRDTKHDKEKVERTIKYLDSIMEPIGFKRHKEEE